MGTPTAAAARIFVGGIVEFPQVMRVQLLAEFTIAKCVVY
jgi:hypothetical protein